MEFSPKISEKRLLQRGIDLAAYSCAGYAKGKMTQTWRTASKKQFTQKERKERAGSY